MKDLPKGWIFSRLEELTKSPKQDIVDGPFGSDLKVSEYINEGVPIIRLQNVDRNRFLEKNIKYISSQKAQELSRHSFIIGDLVVTKLGDPVGKACIVPKSFGPGVIVADVVRVRINEKVASKDFISYAINSPEVISRINLEVKGSTRPRVNLGHIRALEIPIAPLYEQRRIVAKLEKLLEKVETSRTRLEKIPAILKHFRQSVLAAACSGRLTADGRKEDAAENDLPESWSILPLADLSTLITKGASPKWQGVGYTDHGVLFVTSENIGIGKMILKDKKKYVEYKINDIQPRSVLKIGDLLTNIVGASIGRSALFESSELANINQAVALIRLKKNVFGKYILHVLNSPTLVDHMHAEKVDVARANLSLADVSKFPIPVPPLDEQQEIVHRVEKLFILADRIETRYQKAKAQVDKLTQSILSKAFRGELVPQDPNDEPASELLKRIKSQKVEPGHRQPRVSTNRKKTKA